MIIYIHGFGSSGEGSKARVFRKYFKSIGEPFIAPSLSYVPKLAIETLEELIESYHGDVKLIGSSLGGYYAIYLAKKYDLKAVLINPSIKPYDTLKKMLGEAPYYYDDSSYTWNKKHIDMLESFHVDNPQQNNLMLLVQKGDEDLDYREAVQYLAKSNMIVEDGGNHSFKNIEQHFENIRVFFAVGNHFKHTIKPKGVTLSNSQLASNIGDMYYDTLSELLLKLSQKLEIDAKADKDRGRERLADNLQKASVSIEQASSFVQKAWSNCEVHTLAWLAENGDNRDIQIQKELFSVEEYKEVFAFALKAHGEQKIPLGLPYSFHIVSVANEIINSLLHYNITYEEANISIACALLHDVLEDTDTTIKIDSLDIPNMQIVLKGVSALTKDTNLPSKKEQMQDSLKRLKQQPKCVQMVKLADRITNLTPAPIFWNQSKRKYYADEAKIILEVLKDSNPYLANKLQYKIDNYEVDRYINGELILDNYLVFYGEEKDSKIQLILDKNHPNYLETFKALNRLNEYVKKVYNLKLFYSDSTDNTFANFKDKDGFDGYKKEDISYVEKVLATKDLSSDDTIIRYMRVISENKSCMI